MSDTVNLIIEIPKDLYEITKAKVDKGMTHALLSVSIANGKPLSDVLNEIKGELMKKSFKDMFGFNYVSVDALNDILDNIGKAESIDPNNLTHIFDGVTEFPKDAFKGWDTEELLGKIRSESEGK